jgi:hypothetical protein
MDLGRLDPADVAIKLAQLLLKDCQRIMDPCREIDGQKTSHMP